MFAPPARSKRLQNFKKNKGETSAKGFIFIGVISDMISEIDVISDMIFSCSFRSRKQVNSTKPFFEFVKFYRGSIFGASCHKYLELYYWLILQFYPRESPTIPALPQSGPKDHKHSVYMTNNCIIITRTSAVQKLLYLLLTCATNLL